MEGEVDDLYGKDVGWKKKIVTQKGGRKVD
jgi:hypothetical protein